MMKYVFLLAFLCTSLYASIQSSGISFDYENATREERMAWMDHQIALVDKRFARTLSRKYGLNNVIKIEDTKRQGSRAIRTTIKMMMQASHQEGARYATEMAELFCKQYMPLPLADHSIPVQVAIHDIGGRQVARTIIRPSTCDEASGAEGARS
ncbi:MAG: hypothetical protein AAGF20_11665 [Pseudomonadota bacterium]